jgi:Holliday junction resolvase
MASKLQKSIVKYLNTQKIYNFITIHSNRKGIADIIACVNGLFLAIEVKDKGDTIKPLQRLESKSVHESKGFSMFAFSLEDVEEQVKILQKRSKKLQ